ncbi:MAG TPA: potassium transporter Kup [Pedomonas sp.]|uniref:potassium transporter Kup n=1 Tax=Pedomonas sp. TaxID=2976421 RepID=UPI002F3FAEA1
MAGSDVNPHQPQGSLAKLMVGAMGIVYGDIGTSPLYAMREAFAGHHPLAMDQEHIFGVLSLIFWSMVLVVTIKYVVFTMRADNKGEGGSLALLALISHKVSGARWTTGIVVLGVFATALFYGDSMITPAMSVLSAVEGLKVIDPGFSVLVVPLSVVLLVGIFLIQRRGTARVGALFGPIMVVYFTVLAVLGVLNIFQAPQVLLALNPWYAIHFFIIDGWKAFLALGSVVLAVTGAEALYTDMGHFGKKPIRMSWLTVVMPALMLNYLGQGALLTVNPSAIDSPFYHLAPAWALIPMVALTTMATIIASQAVISGAFSVTQQAIQLGFLPRLSIKFTSAEAQGQIYIPFINWGLMVCVLTLVLAFQSSSNLAAAYGIAVTGAMTIDTILLGVVIFMLWRWNKVTAFALLGLFLVVDLTYFAANLTKVPDGGWVPLVIGLTIFTLLTTWNRGRKLVQDKLQASAMPIEVFIKSATASTTRVPGTAVFLTSTSNGVPHALLHNMKHNKILHERVVFLTVMIENVPYVPATRRIEVLDMGQNFYRIIIHYGFMQDPDIPRALARAADYGLAFKMMETSFFLSRQTLVTSTAPGMPLWREKVFSWMMRNATNAMEFFKLPSNRVVELGSQVEI